MRTGTCSSLFTCSALSRYTFFSVRLKRINVNTIHEKIKTYYTWMLSELSAIFFKQVPAHAIETRLKSESENTERTWCKSITELVQGVVFRAARPIVNSELDTRMQAWWNTRGPNFILTKEHADCMCKIDDRRNTERLSPWTPTTKCQCHLTCTANIIYLLYKNDVDHKEKRHKQQWGAM